jgi:hypothetical protein
MKRYRPTPSMGVAIAALLVALGGTGYAAVALPKNSVGSRQIKPAAVKRADIARNAVVSAKVRNGSLTGEDIDPGTLPKPESAAYADRAGTALNADFATSAERAAPTGTADGALTGRYPNPQLAPGAVTPDKISNVPTAILTNSASQAPDELEFDTEVYDPAGMHETTAPGRIEPDVPGVYLIQANVCFEAGTAGERALFFKRGGTTINTFRAFSNEDRATCVSAGTMDRISAGEAVTLDASSSAPASTVLGGRPALNVSMTWVAP